MTQYIPGPGSECITLYHAFIETSTFTFRRSSNRASTRCGAQACRGRERGCEEESGRFVGRDSTFEQGGLISICSLYI